MPIVTELGIVTEELCPDNKKYLSRLLVGKTGIDSSCITWDLLLTEQLTLDAFVETGTENLDQLMESRAEWNRLLKENQLKLAIENKLAEIETHYLSERLKPYDPEVRKQQEDSRHKKRALVSIAIIIGLAIGFPFALPLLAGAATLVGVTSLAIGATLLFCSVIPAFVGERLIDPEWIAEYSHEKNKWQEKILEITTKPEAIIEKAEEPISNKQISHVKQRQPLRVEAATQTIPDDYYIDNSIRFGFFNTVEKLKAENILYDHEQRTFVPTCITS
ncbi:hypothetical protein [Rickettsiella endosymbiont of Miltochrista miniata]|uniref:hypothetical protein n=1 Tax=Rickettsiella endosymbiont of Miltochrista miniata TaxID=3066239 RepID=UPI00313B3ED0